MSKRMLVGMTPGSTIQWQALAGPRAAFYFDPATPAGLRVLLTKPADCRGEKMGDTQLGTAYQVGHLGRSYEIREVRRPLSMESDDYEQACGLTALRKVVALEVGLRNVQATHTLRDGTHLAAPHHLGAFVTRGFARFLLTHETGEPLAAHDDARAGTAEERSHILRAAMESVRLPLHDNVVVGADMGELLIHPMGLNGPEVVLLDPMVVLAGVRQPEPLPIG